MSRHSDAVATDGAAITLFISLTIPKRGGCKAVVAPDGAGVAQLPQVDSALVRALARAFRWQRMLDEGEGGQMGTGPVARYTKFLTLLLGQERLDRGSVADRMARTHLYEAANAIMRRKLGASRLRDRALAIAGRTGPRKAKAALARKLAVILHAMWRTDTPFRDAATA